MTLQEIKFDLFNGKKIANKYMRDNQMYYIAYKFFESGKFRPIFNIQKMMVHPIENYDFNMGVTHHDGVLPFHLFEDDTWEVVEYGKK